MVNVLKIGKNVDPVANIRYDLALNPTAAFQEILDPRSMELVAQCAVVLRELPIAPSHVDNWPTLPREPQFLFGYPLYLVPAYVCAVIAEFAGWWRERWSTMTLGPVVRTALAAVIGFLVSSLAQNSTLSW